MNPYVRALLRFWWLLLIGLGVGAIAVILASYTTSATWPPTFTKRTHPTYSASTNLLVDSTTAPYLRTLETQVTQRPAVVRPTQSKSGTSTQDIAQPPSVTLQPPD